MQEATSQKTAINGAGKSGGNPATNLGKEKLRTMANAVRALSIDAVEAANSGHPGLPLGAADVATVLFTKYLKFDPTCPNWPDRDRFILSAGHGSMLLYALLHLTGYEDMSLKEIKNFRQLGSKAAGHPEYGFAAGIETTTGPLGQGLANAVGMAIAERSLNTRFGDDLVDHYTYVLAGDGDLMEGISHESISHAGQLKLSRLIVLFDDNEICIDGPVSLSEAGNQQARFEAAGWHVQAVDGHDVEAVSKAIEAAQNSDKPSMIACRTKIGFGAPNREGTSGAHGAPLGATELAATKKALGWSGGDFEIPTEVRDAWRLVGLRGVRHRKAWDQRLIDLGNGEKAEFERRMRGDLPAELNSALADLKKKAVKAGEKLATRVASGKVLEVINAVVPETLAGSADLTGSVNTRTTDMTALGPDNYGGRYIHYGIREHGMAAAMNGMALHGGVIPYSGTFLVFSDYCRPAIRLSSLMHQRVVYVMTHDSIGLGEDGPTHQPVEHLAALRSIPGVKVLRPADIVETAECWQLALQNKNGPSVMVLTRQGLPTVRTEQSEKNLCAKGGYIMAPASDDTKVSLLATGSEVEIALAARETLEKQGVSTAVVSMPSFELFEEQTQDYRDCIIAPGSVRIAIEAAVRQGWDRYIGHDGGFVGMSSFGASAPAGDLYKHFGITAEAVVAAVKERL